MHRSQRHLLLKHSGAGSLQILSVLPIAAVAGLSRDNQIEAGNESDQLTARAGLIAGISGNTFTAGSAAFACQQRGQLSAM